MSGHVRPLVLCTLAVGIALLTGSARADTGTFSGSITPTACGAMHPINVVAGETTIDVTAAMTVSANDIKLELYDPTGKQIVDKDTLTSPEAIHYASADLAPGTYNTQVCPFSGGVIAEPYTYTGTFATSNTPVVGVPGSTDGGAGATTAPRYVQGKLVFSPATVIDAQRTEGEPLNFIDGTGFWESGPWGTTTQNSFIHRSTDGVDWHVDSPVGLRPDPGPGGGDTDVVADDQGNIYFIDLEALVNLGTSVSNDRGNTWRKNPAAVQNAAVDRQWYAVDNGTTGAADDNTVFMAFHTLAVGTFIYSSPGSKGSSDAVGGLVWQSSSAKSPAPLANDASCGQLRFDRVKRNLLYACGEGNHVRITIGHVNPGQRTGIEYHNVNAPASPGGGDVGHLFPSVATDAAGNIYASWIDENDNNAYYSYSTDEGATWSTPVRVNGAPSVTNEFLWAQGGDPGTVVLAWLGTETSGTPDSYPSWKVDPQGSTAIKWFGYVSTITAAASKKPVLAQQRFTEKPMHYGQICNQGTLCVASGGDRTMADYFGFNLDREGGIRFVYNDTTSQHHGAHLYEIRQLKGRTPAGGSLNRPVPANPIADAAGDAQWPHYSATGAGANLPQLDLRGVAVSQPSAAVLRVKMTLGSLASLAPPTGKTRSTWLTRFQALSVGDKGEESYRIFYVGADSAGGTAPSFFAGTTTCTDTDPGNCKIVNYPIQVAATGKVCGNVISVDVPLAALGKPVQGTTLFNVTALTFGRNADADIYADVDATSSFDYVLGSATGGSAC
jgi:hypothetical protein